MDLRFPNITAGTDREQIEQIKSYLYQLVGQLEWIFSSIDKGDSAVSGGDVSAIAAAIKPMLIQASEIVSAYYEQMKPSIEKDFCTKREHEKTQKEISALDRRIKAGEELSGRLGNFFYVPFFVSGKVFNIIHAAEGQNIFLFGGGIYGNVFVKEDGTAAFSGSDGIASVSSSDGVITVTLSAEANNVFAAFSAFEFDIFQEG